MPARNVELKALDPDPPRSLATCLAIGARDQGTIEQRDTYFDVPHGLLKLREQRPGETELIQYRRASSPDARQSSYQRVAVSNGPALRDALADALTVTAVVVKHRRLFLWDSVRIHLDRVEQLGSFIEFEAVAAEGSDLREEHELVEQLRLTFAIEPARLLADGYAHQLLARASA